MSKLGTIFSCFKYKAVIFSLLFGIVLNSGNFLFANDTEVFYNEIKGSQIFNGALFQTVDNLYPSGYGVVSSHIKIENLIIFEVNEEDNLYRPNPFSESITIRIRKYDINNVATVEILNLNVNFSNVAGTNYKQKDFVTFENAHRVEVQVMSAPTNNTHVKLSAQISIKRIYNFNEVGLISSVSHSTDFDGQQSSGFININWAAYTGAVEYDLEYTHYNEQSEVVREINLSGAAVTKYSFDYLFENNATRVVLDNNQYSIPHLYSKGYIFYRIRAVTYDENGVRSVTRWTSTGGFGGIVIAQFAQKQVLNEHHSVNKNWSSKRTFIENGKAQSTVEYLDGGLKMRQQVTGLNVEERILVGNYYYDYFGRNSLNIMPYVEDNSYINYVANELVLGSSGLQLNEYDTGDCSYTGVVFPDSKGPGKYYGQQNFYLSSGTIPNFIKYIPDSEGYHYSQTRYTPDRTNRIARVSGPGLQLKPGSGHETRYYYGKPTQVEMDRLFGNAVGLARHYEKNMIVDPNNGVSVSYLNASGQVIATSLAGESPDAFDELDSNNDTTKVELTDYINDFVVANGRLVSSFTYLAGAPVDIEIVFNLSPSAYTNECNSELCFSCLYDAILTVNDNCGGINIIETFENYTLDEYNTSCSSGSDLEKTINIPASQVSVGEIYIKLEIFISESALASYVDSYMENNTCLPSLEDLDDYFDNAFDIGCFESCDQCLESLGTLSEFTNAYQASLVEKDLPWTAAEEDEAERMYMEALKICDQFCNAPTMCNNLKEMMKIDITPGGQYALYDIDTLTGVYSAEDPASIFYNPELPSALYRNPESGYYKTKDGTENERVHINGIDYYPHTLELKYFIENWQPHWAEQLLIYHPEFCFLEWCIENEEELAFEQELLNTYTIADAIVKGFNINNLWMDDPFFDIGGIGAGYILQIQEYFNNVSHFGMCDTITLEELIVSVIYCEGVFPCEPPCEPYNDLYWISMRNIYLSKRYEIMCELSREYAENDCSVSLITPFDCIGSEEASGCGTVNHYAEKQLRWYCPPPVSEEDLLALIDKFNDVLDEGVLQMIEDCQSSCEQFADFWIGQLGECDCLEDEENVDAIKLRFIEICQTGCDVNHPFGSTTIDGTTSYGDSSFEDVLNSVCGQNYDFCDADCNVNNINFPPPYDKELNFGGENMVMVTEEDCICENLSDLLACYNNKPLIDSTSSFLEFLSQLSNQVLTQDELDNLMTRCFDYNVCDTLSYELILPPYLICGSCKPAAEVAAFDQLFRTSCTVFDQEAYRMFMNIELGLNLNYFDYEEFLARWEDYDEIVACEQGYVLCPVVLPGIEEVENCRDYIVEFIAVQKMMAYESIRDSLINTFRGDYRDFCLNNYEEVTYEFTRDHKEYHYTLYYYDQAGNLINTIPPDGVSYLSDMEIAQAQTYRNTQAGSPVYNSHSFITGYKMNSLNQALEQTTPDGGLTKYWYDLLGRVVLSQEARMAPSRYNYVKYDGLGRIEEQGNFFRLQSVAASPLTEELIDIYFNAATLFNDVTRFYYDEIKFPTAAAEFEAGAQDNLLLRPVSVAFYTTYSGNDNNYNYATHYSYDIAGNAKEIIQEIVDSPASQRYKKIKYDFDLVSGNVNKVYYQPGEEDQFIHRYAYDADNRLSMVETSVDGHLWDRDGFYRYYPHGPLGRLEIGQLQVQGLDYVYTLQGWLKAVNAARLFDDLDVGQDGRTVAGQTTNRYVARDAIAFTLGYFYGDYLRIGSASARTYPELRFAQTTAFNQASLPLYNGNIRNSMYAIRNLNGNLTTGYTYTYDQLNRIKSMETWSGYSANNWNSVTGPDNALNTTYSYTGNGNITALTRKDDTGNLFDDLEYEYVPGTNKLVKVTDTAPFDGTHGDIEDQTASVNYTYDASGNLTGDAAEGLTIGWNYSGKVVKVTKSNNDEIEFMYDGMGQRVVKIVRPWTGDYETRHIYVRDAGGNVMAVNEYIRTKYNVPPDPDNFMEYKLKELHIYGSSRLGLLREEKVLETSGEEPGLMMASTLAVYGRWMTGRKRYELNNHLGNVVSVISDRKVGHGVVNVVNFSYYNADIRSATEYYPFGAQMPGRQVAGEYRYGFNGQEKDDEVKGSSNSYDFGARIYDPRLGIFQSVDPLAGTMPSWSPYNFVFNNPLRFVDPLGLAPDDWVKREDGSVYWDKNANDQASTKAGETYLGKTLTFEYNSYIDAELWDGPLGSIPAGDKLTSTIKLTGNENDAGELVGLTATKNVVPGPTPVGAARDYFSGLGDDQNKFSFSKSSGSLNLNFEQHASVSWQEEAGLNLMGYDIVNVAQKLTLGLKGNNLSISAGTDVFPSATLSLNGSQLFKYNQPSFRATHGKDTRTILGDNGMGGSVTTETVSRRPTPSFYTRYKN